MVESSFHNCGIQSSALPPAQLLALVHPPSVRSAAEMAAERQTPSIVAQVIAEVGGPTVSSMA